MTKQGRLYFFYYLIAKYFETLFSHSGEDDPNSEVAKRESGLHLEGILEQKSGGSSRLTPGDRIHGDHDPSLLQVHRMGSGELLTLSLVQIEALSLA